MAEEEANILNKKPENLTKRDLIKILRAAECKHNPNKKKSELLRLATEQGIITDTGVTVDLPKLKEPVYAFPSKVRCPNGVCRSIHTKAQTYSQSKRIQYRVCMRCKRRFTVTGYEI